MIERFWPRLSRDSQITLLALSLGLLLGVLIYGHIEPWRVLPFQKAIAWVLVMACLVSFQVRSIQEYVAHGLVLGFGAMIGLEIAMRAAVAIGIGS